MQLTISSILSIIFFLFKLLATADKSLILLSFSILFLILLELLSLLFLSDFLDSFTGS